MDDVRCPRCGGSVPPNAAFCGLCGAPISAQQPPQEPPQPPVPPPPPPPPPANNTGAPGWQQLPSNPPLPPPPPPPGYYPPPVAGSKILGDKTKWALGLGIAALFCCGPFTGIPGIVLAKQDMDEAASGRSPHLDDTWAKVAFYLNIGALVLFVVGLCLFWGTAGMRRIL